MSNIKILAIESSGINSGIAIGNEDNLIYESSLYLKHSHDETLAYQIREALNFLNITAKDLSAVAVSSGPGSFTGLRVGGAIAKGLTFGQGPRLIDVPTLQAIAYASAEFAKSLGDKSIYAIIPSNQEKYFVQEFDSEAKPSSEIALLQKEEVIQLELSNNVVCGTGADTFKGNNYQLSGLNRLTPRFILKFAQEKFSKQEFVESDKFTPKYYQDFIPAQKKDKK